MMSGSIEASPIVEVLPGNMPFIVSCHHDGPLKTLHGRNLRKLRNVANDTGTRNFVLQVHSLFGFVRPTFVIFNVAKAHSTEEMFTLYYFELLKAVEKCLKKNDECAVLDIHRFHKHPVVDGRLTSFGAWFGTDYRKTVNNDFDSRLAGTLEETANVKGIEFDVYVPGSKPKTGERFMATGKTKGRRIVTKLISEIASFWGVKEKLNAVQIEIYKDWFSLEKSLWLAAIFSDGIMKLDSRFE